MKRGYRDYADPDNPEGYIGCSEGITQKALVQQDLRGTQRKESVT